jgi:ABC-type branched-subunit amino acid transport system substrate-binding protein
MPRHQISGSVHIETAGIAEAVSDTLNPSFEALHASLAALSARLDASSPSPLIKPLNAVQAQRVLYLAGVEQRTSKVVEALEFAGYALIKVPVPQTEPAPSIDQGVPRTTQDASWFDRTTD